MKAGRRPSVAYEKLGDSLSHTASYTWNEIVGGGPAVLGRISVVVAPGRYINLASVNMDHFLTDLFGAGHVRTPRRAPWSTPQTIAGETGLLTRAAHHEENRDGLHVQNAAGHQWVAYGDGTELDTVNADNFSTASAALQASADEVYHALVTGVATVPGNRLPDGTTHAELHPAY